MSTQHSPWSGRFVWHDLITKDAAKAQAFYQAMFDWHIEARPMPGGVYRMISLSAGPMGGIVEQNNVPMSHWMPYLAVDDVDATARQFTARGGSVRVPPTDMPGTGRFAVVADPQGAFLSIFRGLPASPGMDPDVAVPGRVCWNELLTTDADAAPAFYRAVFGWSDEPKDMGPMGTYHVMKLGDKQVGGMMKNPQNGAPSCWLAYFFVEDLAAATQKAKGLGATVLVANAPIEGIGGFSLLVDPVGAVIALFWPQPGSLPG